MVAFCDFNGTIVDRDMIDHLASSVGDECIDAAVERHSRADIARRASMITYDRDEAERRIDNGVLFDESFLGFSTSCASAGVALIILTSGVEELVGRYLSRRGVDVPVFGNQADFLPDGWSIRFRDDSVAGIDKRQFVVAARAEGRFIVVIGDDRSDFEAALAADLVFAKASSELLRFLDVQDRAYHAFRRFADILERWPPNTW